MIPKTIHYCWVGGNPLPDEAKRCIESWKKFCPDYEIIRWDESNFDFDINAYCKEAYEAKKWAFVSDYIRLKVLYDYGGIYMDSDVEVVKPLDPLLKYDAFSGFEKPDKIPTGTMGAVKGNEWINLLLDDYELRHFIKPDGSYDFTTNVTVITKLTFDKYHIKLDGTKQIFGNNMIMLPFDYLCAKDYSTGKISATENTYTIHNFAGSWTKDKDVIIQNLKFENLYFKHYFGLNANNRWIKTANIIPWKELDEKYSKTFDKINLPEMNKTRFILGLLLIQDKYNYSDTEMSFQLNENKYYQAFCGVNLQIYPPPSHLA